MKKLILIIATLVILWEGYSFLSLWNEPIDSQDFIVTPGDTLYTLPKKLNIDVSLTLYKLWIRTHYADFVLQAGSYHVSEWETLSSLFQKTLTEPLAKDLTITILPGWNIYDIDAYLAKASIIKPGELSTLAKGDISGYKKKYPFLSSATSLEGFLFPDTYRISPDSTASSVIKVLLDEFATRIAGKTQLSGARLYETVILASIVEREEKNSENKRVVAGILAKRLREGIALWADATVCYPYDLTQKECTPEFIGEHIYEKSDYNTRLMRGLPPTPISNISSDTFLATESPQSSPYYYYLHDDLGVIHYAEDLAGHNSNRTKYLGK